MACITTSFVRALVETDARVLDTLLKIGECNFHIDDMIENKMPALHFAVLFRLVDTVKVLLKHGANVNLEDKDGKTCLHLAIASAVYTRNIERVRQLLKDVLLDSACKEKLTAPFSTDPEHQQRVQSFFDSNRSILPYVINYADSVDNTLLVELLLSSGANPNHEDHLGCIPLLTYCYGYNCKDIRVTNLLLQYGADVNMTDNNHGATALGIAALHGTVEMVEKLLDAGADVNKLSSGELPLSLAARNGSGDEVIASIIKLLISRGANVNAFDAGHDTPLQEAIHHSSLEGVECLLRLGANPNLHEAINEESGPPLYFSVRFAEVEITECLINYGADVFYQDSDRCSLLNTAMLLNKKPFALQLVTLLMERGVTIGEHDDTDLTSKKIKLLQQCQCQIQTLKKTKIYYDSPTTYFEFLLKRGKELVRCLRDENIATALKSEEYKEEFVYFVHRLEANYDRGSKHIDMIDDLRSILSDVFKEVFPEELIFMISDHFNLEDLKKCFGN